MKRVSLAALGALASFCVTQAADAADIPRRPAPVAPAAFVPPAYNWTGPYIGINGGGGWGSSTWGFTDSFGVSGGLIGGTLGYNWQTGPWVLGVEGDIDWSSLRGSTTTFCPAGCETSNSWLATVRGRLGYAFDRFLPYVTGGAAFGDIHAERPGFVGDRETRAGWTVGGGLEFALAGNWTAKVEYLHVDLGNFDCGFSCGTAFGNNVSFQADIVRGGLNFRF
jgi:outer membrane immunogenic protein